MELEEEITELEKRFAEAPESRLFLPLADALARAGELERALELCRKGLESYPDFSAARVLMARCLAELDRREESERLLGEILSDDEANVIALKQMGNLIQERGDTGQAFSLYRKAYALGGDDAELSQALMDFDQQAEIKSETEVSPKASEESLLEEEVEAQRLEEELTFDYEQPGEIFITHTLADIYRLQGYFERARKIYDKLLDQDPDNETLKRKLDEIASRLATAEPVGVDTGQADDGVLAEIAGAKETEAFNTDAVAASPELPEFEERAPVSRQEPVAAEDELTGRVNLIFDQLLGEKVSETPATGKTWVEGSWSDQPEEYLESLENWLGDLKKQGAR